jgi:hypothetical protein
LKNKTYVMADIAALRAYFAMAQIAALPAYFA